MKRTPETSRVDVQLLIVRMGEGEGREVVVLLPVLLVRMFHGHGTSRLQDTAAEMSFESLIAFSETINDITH